MSGRLCSFHSIYILIANTAAQKPLNHVCDIVWQHSHTLICALTREICKCAPMNMSLALLFWGKFTWTAKQQHHKAVWYTKRVHQYRDIYTMRFQWLWVHVVIMQLRLSAWPNVDGMFKFIILVGKCVSVWVFLGWISLTSGWWTKTFVAKSLRWKWKYNTVYFTLHFWTIVGCFFKWKCC